MAMGAVAFGAPDHNSLSDELFKLTGSGIEKIEFKTLPDQAAPQKPTDFLYSWSGANRYAVASTVVLPDFKGWKGVNGVAVGGYRIDPNGDVPVFGAGLEYPRQFTISGTFRVIVTVGFDYLFEQGQSLSQGQGRFRLSGGVRF
jgi:hypothetical protein